MVLLYVFWLFALLVVQETVEGYLPSRTRVASFSPQKVGRKQGVMRIDKLDNNRNRLGLSKGNAPTSIDDYDDEYSGDDMDSESSGSVNLEEIGVREKISTEERKTSASATYVALRSSRINRMQNQVDQARRDQTLGMLNFRPYGFNGETDENDEDYEEEEEEEKEDNNGVNRSESTERSRLRLGKGRVSAIESLHNASTVNFFQWYIVKVGSGTEEEVSETINNLIKDPTQALSQHVKETLVPKRRTPKLVKKELHYLYSVYVPKQVYVKARLIPEVKAIITSLPNVYGIVPIRGDDVSAFIREKKKLMNEYAKEEEFRLSHPIRVNDPVEVLHEITRKPIGYGTFLGVFKNKCKVNVITTEGVEELQFVEIGQLRYLEEDESDLATQKIREAVTASEDLLQLSARELLLKAMETAPGSRDLRRLLKNRQISSLLHQEQGSLNQKPLADLSEEELREIFVGTKKDSLRRGRSQKTDYPADNLSTRSPRDLERNRRNRAGSDTKDQFNRPRAGYFDGRTSDFANPLGTDWDFSHQSRMKNENYANDGRDLFSDVARSSHRKAGENKEDGFNFEDLDDIIDSLSTSSKHSPTPSNPAPFHADFLYRTQSHVIEPLSSSAASSFRDNFEGEDWNIGDLDKILMETDWEDKVGADSQDLKTDMTSYVDNGNSVASPSPPRSNSLKSARVLNAETGNTYTVGERSEYFDAPRNNRSSSDPTGGRASNSKQVDETGASSYNDYPIAIHFESFEAYLAAVNEFERRQTQSPYNGQASDKEDLSLSRIDGDHEENIGQDYTKKTVRELKELLVQKNLPTSGTKSILIERLLGSLFYE